MTDHNDMHETFGSLRFANRARQKEWDSDARITTTYRATELGGEVGEALNVVKKLERERLGIKGSRATVDQLASELADIVICVDLLAEDYGIDLGLAVRNTFNAKSEEIGLSTRSPGRRITRAEYEAAVAENRRLERIIRD